MQRIILLSLFLLSTSPLLAGEQFFTLDVKGTIEIGPDGSVSDHKITSKLTEPVLDLVEKHIRSWRFEPIEIDGKPVIAKTSISLNLKATPIGDDLQLEVKSVHFGIPKKSKTGTPPRYPMAAASNYLEAEVLLAARVDTSGQVLETHVMQVSLNQELFPAKAAKWRRTFAKAATKSATTWRYELSEHLNGKPIESVYMIPINFILSQENGWDQRYEGPWQPHPWQQEAEQKTYVANNNSEQGVNLSSHFKLKTPVEGAIL